MTPSKILFFLCLSFILGVFAESAIRVPHFFLWAFLFGDFLAIITFIFLRKENITIVGFCILFLIIGIIRFQISEFNMASDTLAQLNGKGTVVVSGVISNEPDVRDASQKIEVNINGSNILITTGRYAEYKYLDRVKITGKLETPAVFSDFNYKNYLLKDNIYSVINYPKIEITSKEHQYNIFSFIYEKILYVKEKLNDSIQNNFSPPQSLLLEGILLGSNKNMTQKLRDQLNATGLRFLTAISGVHIVILSAILISFLMSLGLWRHHAFYISIIFIWLYIVITSFSASGVRAGIMGSIFIFAQALGRQNTSSRIIILAGALMLLQNPLLLPYDVGFQLSFLASFGIIYCKPLLDILLKKIFKDKLKNISDIIATTLTAQLYTLPVMIYNFGTVSLIAPITNILILPVVYWILTFGFLFSMLGIFSHVLGFILSVPCWLLVIYFLKVMDIFSQPWAFKTIQNVSWMWLGAYYILLSFVILFFHRSKKINF